MYHTMMNRNMNALINCECHGIYQLSIVNVDMVYGPGGLQPYIWVFQISIYLEIPIGIQ